MTLFNSKIYRTLLLALMLLSPLGLSSALGQTTTNYTDYVLPWSTNGYWKALEIDPALYGSAYRIDLFSPKNGEEGARVWSQSKTMVFYGAGVALFLAALPESATGWETESDIFSKWVENVKEGPVWDRDNWAYNYLGHAYTGGVYYQIARKSGYRQWDSFVYTALMSTFFWEYGVEAFAEVPSIQDLVYTPLIGWVYGEWSYQTELGIRHRGNKVAGSKILGETSLFFLDPVDSLGRGWNRLVNRRWVNAGYGYFTYVPTPIGDDVDHTVYLNVRFPLGGSVQPEPSEPIRLEYRDDPVDTGVVGISLGGGYTRLDKDLNIEDDYVGSVSLGLYFTPRFSARLDYARGTLLDTVSGNSVIYENYSIDGQYYFNVERKLRPYISVGFGEQMWDESLEQKAFQLNAALGIHWKLHNKWALQADWRNYYSFDQEFYDQNFNARLIYRFGRGEHDAW